MGTPGRKNIKNLRNLGGQSHPVGSKAGIHPKKGVSKVVTAHNTHMTDRDVQCYMILALGQLNDKQAEYVTRLLNESPDVRMIDAVKQTIIPKGKASTDLETAVDWASQAFGFLDEETLFTNMVFVSEDYRSVTQEIRIWSLVTGERTEVETIMRESYLRGQPDHRQSWVHKVWEICDTELPDELKDTLRAFARHR